MYLAIVGLNCWLCRDVRGYYAFQSNSLESREWGGETAPLAGPQHVQLVYLQPRAATLPAAHSRTPREQQDAAEDASTYVLHIVAVGELVEVGVGVRVGGAAAESIWWCQRVVLVPVLTCGADGRHWIPPHPTAVASCKALPDWVRRHVQWSVR